MSSGTPLTDHERIRSWVEERGGLPAAVRGTGDESEPGILRIDFPGYGEDEKLEHIGWEEWFEKFEEASLALMVQEEDDSRFNKLVSRANAEKH